MDAALWCFKVPFIILGWVIVGSLAGSLARQFMKAPDLPFLQDLLLGLAGAVVGGWLMGFLKITDIRPDYGLPLVIFNLVVATLTGALLIFVGRMVRGGAKATA